MDFLLECVGFPPGQNQDELIELIRRRGEAVAWRGPAGEHLRLELAQGIELRLDREDGEPLSLLPYFQEPYRLRVALERMQLVEDSPFDALLTGWAAPPAPDLELAWGPPGAYLLSTWLTDARRLPHGLTRGRVLAVQVAGFALDVSYVGPNEGVRDLGILDAPRGALIQPLGGSDSPGGCTELSGRVREIRHVRNPMTERPVDVLEIDAPERPLHLFVSPWQLEQDGLPQPRPGWRIEGTFLFTGRIAGGLPRPKGRARRAFG